MTTKKGENRKDQIVREAFKCVYRFGLKQTTPSLITERLKQPQSLFFYYFPKQEDLYPAMVNYLLATNMTMMMRMMSEHAPKSAIEKIFVYLKATMAWAKEFPEQIAILHYSVIEASVRPEMKTLAMTALEGGEEKLFAMINEGLGAKEFTLASQHLPRDCARTLHQALIGAVLHVHLFAQSREKIKGEIAYLERLEKLAKVLLLNA